MVAGSSTPDNNSQSQSASRDSTSEGDLENEMSDEHWDDRDFACLARRYLSDEATRNEYIRQAWLARAVASLRDSRLTAGLTQTELANRLGTTQSAIARLERDDTGATSLHRFIDFAIACGMVPFDLVLASAADVAGYAVTQPLGPWTQLGFDTWSGQASATNVARYSPVTPAVTRLVDGILARPGSNALVQPAGGTETVRGHDQKEKAA
jgi:DNA-binding XRE family transcriptional regulator